MIHHHTGVDCSLPLSRGAEVPTLNKQSHYWLSQKLLEVTKWRHHLIAVVSWEVGRCSDRVAKGQWGVMCLDGNQEVLGCGEVLEVSSGEELQWISALTSPSCCFWCFNHPNLHLLLSWSWCSHVFAQLQTASYTDNEMLPFEWLQPHIVRHFSQFIFKLTFDPVEFVFKAVICIAAGDNTVQQQKLLAV